MSPRKAKPGELSRELFDQMLEDRQAWHVAPIKGSALAEIKDENGLVVATATREDAPLVAASPELRRIAEEMHRENMAAEWVNKHLDCGRGTMPSDDEIMKAHRREEPNCEYCRIIQEAR